MAHIGKWAGLLVLLSLAPVIQSAEAVYYECNFEQSYSSEKKSGSFSHLNLRFMLNMKFRLAFRIDTQVARPVTMYVSEYGDITLTDYQQGAEIVLVTMSESGGAVLSRHIFAKNGGRGPNANGNGPDAQLYSGTCLEVSKVAGISPKH